MRILWIDAHGDFNTPETTPSGFLGGMCLGAACARWDAGWPQTIDPEAVHFLGVRELDPGEREDVAAAGVKTGVPAEGPVYVHLDVDSLDPSVMPVQFPVPGGLSLDEVRDALRALADDGRLVGIEVTALEDPGHAETVAGLLPSITPRDRCLPECDFDFFGGRRTMNSWSFVTCARSSPSPTTGHSPRPPRSCSSRSRRSRSS